MLVNNTCSVNTLSERQTALVIQQVYRTCTLKYRSERTLRRSDVHPVETIQLHKKK